MASRRPPDFSELLARLTRELESHELPFMLIGGQAVLLHGAPRLTEDIDVTLGVGPESLPTLRAAARALRFETLPQEPETFVRETFVLPVRDPESGIRVDFIFSTTAYERQAIARAIRVRIAGVAVPFATAEDLLIHKLFAGRATDWEDALGVVRRKGSTIDWGYLDRWAKEFAGVAGRERMPKEVERLKREADR